MKPDDLVPVCTVGGCRWWQLRRVSRSHISSLTQVKPENGDVLVSVEDDVLMGQRIGVTLGGAIMLSKPTPIALAPERTKYHGPVYPAILEKK